jgi:UDP-2-acetamido-2-deoxy-ribo-hexuluronate aminotransferase
MARPADRNSAHAQYTVLVDERDAVQAALRAAGIPTVVHYPVPVDRQPAYRRFGTEGGCPAAQALAERVLSLPMGPYLPDADIHTVCAALLQAVGATGEAAAAAAEPATEPAAEALAASAAVPAVTV